MSSHTNKSPCLSLHIVFSAALIMSTWLCAQSTNVISNELSNLTELLEGGGSIAALNRLAIIGKAAVPDLIRALSFPDQDSKASIKGDIALTLGKLGDTTAVAPLHKLFYHPDQKVREKGYKALIMLGWKPTALDDKALVLLTSPNNELEERPWKTPDTIIHFPKWSLPYNSFLLKDVNNVPALDAFVDRKGEPEKTREDVPQNIVECVRLGREVSASVTQLLGHSDHEVRNRACRVLGLLKDELAVGALVDLFVEDNLSRDAAGEALVSYGSSSLILLIQLLKDKNTGVAATAARLIGEIEPKTPLHEKAMEALVGALKNKNDAMRENAITSLGSFKSERAARVICDAMRSAASNEEQIRANMRQQFAGFLGSPPKGTLTAFDVSVDGAMNYESTAWALVMNGIPSVIPLVEAIGNCNSQGESELAMWYAIALGNIGQPDAIESLLKLALSDWDDSGHVRAAAAYALARIGKPAIDALMVMLSSSERADIRRNAVDAFGVMHRRDKVIEPKAIIALVMRLDDSDERVSARARETLQSVTGANGEKEVFIRYVYSQVAQGKSIDVLPIALSYQELVERKLAQILAFASERQRLSYAASMKDLCHPFSMFVAVGSAEGMAKSVLHLKGIVLDSLLEDIQIAEQSEDPSVKTLVVQLKKAKESLYSNVNASSGSERRASQQLVALLESQLADHLATTVKTRRDFAIGVPEVQAKLSTNTVLLEFVLYNQPFTNGNFEKRYGVVLIGGSKVAFNGAKPGEPVWVPLGSAETIEQSLKEYRAVMRGEKRGEASLLNRLYTRLLDPIQQRLPKGINTLIISPDAELNFVNLATLLDGQGKFLAEKYTIKYVSSGRDLVFGRKAGRGTRRLSAFANPAFGEKPGLAGKSDTNIVKVAMLATDQRDYAGVNLLPLPGTAIEAGYLRDKSAGWKLEDSVYEGAGASEAEVKAVKSPYILHLATHGFFLPDTTPTNRPDLGMRMLDEGRLPVVWHNPMQRSGLAFAGAQLTLDAWKRGETPDPENDGILMAQEVGTMDLKGTWLVVLSACDTGVGEARAGEGVMGLRRGFIQAGAQNLMMTLWPVSDRWTMDMMKAFYERAIKTGDAPMALAEVQREFLVKMREQKGPVMAARLAGPFVMTFQGETSK